MSYSHLMKTSKEPPLQADPVITEVRRIKTALAAKYGFNVLDMVKALQERQQKIAVGASSSLPQHRSP